MLPPRRLCCGVHFAPSSSPAKVQAAAAAATPPDPVTIWRRDISSRWRRQEFLASSPTPASMRAAVEAATLSNPMTGRLRIPSSMPDLGAEAVPLLSAYQRGVSSTVRSTAATVLWWYVSSSLELLLVVVSPDLGSGSALLGWWLSADVRPIRGSRWLCSHIEYLLQLIKVGCPLLELER